MCGQCGGLQLSGLRAWMEPSSRFGLCRYGASRLLSTGEEGLSQTVLLLSWMMLMWHFFQRLNLFVIRFRFSICVTKLKEALFWQVSVVTTFCQWHAEPQVIVVRFGNVSLWHWLPACLFGVASVGHAASVLEWRDIVLLEYERPGT